MSLHESGSSSIDLTELLSFCYEKGLISEFSDIFYGGIETDVFKVLNAVDRVYDRFYNCQLLHLFNMMSYETIIGIKGPMLDDMSKRFGITQLSGDSLEVKRSRLYNAFKENSFGGTSQALKNVIYYYILPKNLDYRIDSIEIVDTVDTLTDYPIFSDIQFYDPENYYIIVDGVRSIENDPPGSPLLKQQYLVDSVPTGAWVGHSDDIATWNGSTWDFIAPTDLDRLVICDDNLLYEYDGTGTQWVDVTDTHDTNTMYFFDFDALGKDNIIINITFIESGDDTKRNNRDFWELEENLIKLHKIINEKIPAGFMYKLNLI